MAQSDRPPPQPISTAENGNSSNSSLWRRLFGRDSTAPGMSDSSTREQGSRSDDDPTGPGLIRRVSRKVVPGLPRAQTFKRQQSEVRTKLEPVPPTSSERRAVSVDRRLQASQNGSQTQSHPRSSAPDLTRHSFSSVTSAPAVPSVPVEFVDEQMVGSDGNLALPLDGPQSRDDSRLGGGHAPIPDSMSTADCHSMTTSQYDALIHEELERTWILNLSMHFRDKSKREKFFVTYRERPTMWRRVTISVDYRNAPENSLEMELAHIKYQRDKIAKIYDAIRESLVDIQFYPTVTNLKLQTTEGRLHVHVVEDANEIIHYPSVRTIQHMRCNRVRERDIEFDSHISGFVYKVRVNDEVLIKKEIPGPDTVDEFLYEINALNRLKHSHHVIRFYGVIVDDNEEHVKGLLISNAEQGALVDIIYDQIHPLRWPTRERWARQIVAGLSEIHEAGFVQGDFTLSNIVIDDDDNAKIIDINRRGCPVGWEPPEATPLIESNQRISMYIGIKSDLYQLGMVLWALAMQEDEPEAHGRPLRIGPDVPDVPDWFRRVTDICLSEDPRGRMPALQLLSIFPDPEPESDVDGLYDRPSISVDDGVTRRECFVEPESTSDGYPHVRTVQPASDWSYVGWGHSYVNSPNGLSDEPFYYPTRGRSPPSPLPSNPGEYDRSKYGYRTAAWASTAGSLQTAPSESCADTKEEVDEGNKILTPRMSQLSLADAEQGRVVSGLEEQKPDADWPAEETGGALTGMADIGEHMDSTRKSDEPQTWDEPQTPLADPCVSKKVPDENAVREEREISKTEAFDESAPVRQQKDGVQDPPETGHTEPEMQHDASESSATETRRRGESETDQSTNEAHAADADDLNQASGQVERSRDRDTAPDSRPPYEEAGNIAQAAALPHKIEETHPHKAEGTGSTADSTPANPSDPSSESRISSDEHCTVPDVLKGMGSTCETGPEDWHQSMTDRDIAALIDAEMAAGHEE